MSSSKAINSASEHEVMLLTAAARGNLTRSKIAGRWKFRLDGRGEINRKPVLDLMRRGFLEPTGIGPPIQFFQRIDITVRGRDFLRSLL